mmetsp:Transcript_8182/g.13596  ORF Transcript_8182/g.13596 Transcript_8182/m.13596 type:complete len:229 (+) Transcript_8182:61-747(+)
MQLFLVVVFAFLSVAVSFQVSTPTVARRGFFSSSVRMMSDDPKPSTPKPSFDLVPLDKTNIENAAAVTGGILGFVLGGPVFGAILAAITNYVSKKDGDSGDALRGVGKTVIESYNFLGSLNTKYSVTDKVGESVGKAVNSIETESEVLEKVKSAYTKTTSKLSELDKEYDLVGKGKEAIVAAATISDAAIDKTIELNEKYDFVSTAKDAASKAVEKAKEATKEVGKTD